MQAMKNKLAPDLAGAATSDEQDEVKYGAKRLTPEERLAIPALYVAHGSVDKVAEHLKCHRDTVQRWLDKLSGEEFERLQDDQRKILLQKSVGIIYKAMGVVDENMPKATMRDALGAVKIMRDAVAAWGGIGALKRTGDNPADELESLLAAAELKRLRMTIEAALATGSLEPLRALATEAPVPVPA